MLYNKNNVRKTNDKKILHKVGKQWKVISVALLMAIGGGAAVAATNNNANAQSTNGASVNVQSEAANLENDNYKAPQSASASSQASSNSAKAPSLANVSYAPSARVYGNNASAASYNNHADFDKANIQYYGPTVKKYVNSINAKFPEARNLASSYSDASGKAVNDNKLAKSYSAVYANPTNGSIVSGLASKAGLTMSDYIDSVGYAHSGYASQVSAGSDELNVMSLVNSVADGVLNGNTQLSSANAHANFENASANYNIASANSSANAYTIKAVSNANSLNQSALDAANSASVNASENAHIARVYSGIDIATVNSAAKIASFGTSNTSSFASSASVSSAISALASTANKLNSKFYFSNGSNDANAASTVNVPTGYTNYYALNNADNANNELALSVGDYNMNADANASDMMRVISDTAALSAQASVSASAGKTIASANAYKAAHANDLSSAAAQAQNDKSNVASASSAVAIAAANDVVASVIAQNTTTSAAAINFAENVSTNLAGVKQDLVNAVVNNPYFANANGSYHGVSVNELNSAVNAANDVAANIKANGLKKAIKGVNNPDMAALESTELNKAITAANSDVVKNAPATKVVSGITYNFKGTTVDNNGIWANYVNATNGVQLPIAPVVNRDQLANKIVTAANNKYNQVVTDVQNAAAKHGISIDNIDQAGAILAFKNAAEASASAAGMNVSDLLDNKPAIHDFADATKGYANSLMASNANANVYSVASNAMSLAESSAASSYNNVVSASNSYSTATDQDVTLASYFASSFASDANSEDTVATSAHSALNSYYVATANNAEFTTAFNAYNTANGELANDETLAHAFGVNVLHHSPQFVTLTKDAVLHTGVGFTKKNAVKSVKAGSQFAVKGVGFDEVGTLRYVVGTDDNQPVYLTANDAYVENSYLEPEGTATVKFTKNANAHKGLNFNSKVVGSVKAGQTVTGNVVATLSDNSYDHYFGVARLQLSDGSYVTANQNYFTVVPTNNGNDNNDHSESAKSNNNYVRDLVLFK